MFIYRAILCARKSEIFDSWQIAGALSIYYIENFKQRSLHSYQSQRMQELQPQDHFCSRFFADWALEQLTRCFIATFCLAMTLIFVVMGLLTCRIAIYKMISFRKDSSDPRNIWKMRDFFN